MIDLDIKQVIGVLLDHMNRSFKIYLQFGTTPMKHNSFGARIRIVEFQIMGLQSQVMLVKD